MPLNDMFTQALMQLGMDVRHAERVLHKRFGFTWRELPETALYSALEQYVTARGGLNIPTAPDPTTGLPSPLPISQIVGGPVARQEAKARSFPLGPHEMAPPGQLQWQQTAYDPSVFGYSLGYDVTGGQITMGAPAEKAKYWRQAGQQGPMAWYEDLPVESMGILAQLAQVPEPVQRVKAFVSMGPVAGEGVHYFDPSLGRQTIPFTERIMLPQDLDPTTIDIARGMSIPTSGDPRVLFKGHTGLLEPRFEEAKITGWGVVGRETGGKAYNELVIQGAGYFPPGALHGQKFAVKGGNVPLPGLQEKMGVQYLPVIRDPVLAAANIFGMLTSAQRREIAGRDVERWEPSLYPKILEKYIIPRLEERWMPEQTYQTADPIAQELLAQGMLRNIQPVGDIPIGSQLDPADPEGLFRTGAFRAERRVVGFEAPFGVQPTAPWLWQRDVLSYERMRDIRRVHGEPLYQHLEGIAAPRRAALEQVGGAYLANVEPGRSQFMSVPAEKVGWASANAAVIAQLEERGIEPGEATPGLVAQMLMRAVGERPEVRGKGISFPGPGGGRIVMPNPAAVGRYGLDTPVEDMPWGFARQYGKVMESYLGREQEGGRAQYDLALRKALGAEKGSLEEIARSPAFSRALLGAPIGKARMGGRFAPMEDVPINRWFTGKALLTRHLAPHVARGVDPAGLAERMIAGKAVGARALIHREPVSEETGISEILSFISYPELAKYMPGLTMATYEQMGQNIRFHTAFGPTVEGDYDIDPYTGTIVSKYTRSGMEHLAKATSVEEMMGRIARDPAQEIEKLREKIRTTGSVTAAIEMMRGAQQTHPIADIAAALASRAEGQGRIGGTYSAFIRRLGPAISGESALAVQARSEIGGESYRHVQEMNVPTGPQAELEDLIMRLNVAKFGYIKGGADRENISQEDLRNLRNPEFAMGAAFRAMSRWEDVSPESRAVALSSTGAAGPKQISALAAEIERFNAAGTAKDQAGSMQRIMQIATGEKVPTWQKFAESPFGGVMYSGAAYRARAREDYVMGTEMAPLAERGAAQQQLIDLLSGRLPLGEMPAAIEAAIAQNIVTPEEAQSLKRVMMKMQITPTAQTAGGAQETPSTDPGGRKPMPSREEVDPRRAAVRQALGDIVLGDMPRAVAAARVAQSGGGQSAFRRVLNSMVRQYGGDIQELWEEELGGMGLTMGREPGTGAPYHMYREFEGTATGGLGARQQAAAGGAPRRHYARPRGGGPAGGAPGGGGWGPPEGLSGIWRQTISGTPGEGYRQYSSTQEFGLTGEQRSTVGAILQYEKALTARAEQLNRAIEAGKTLNKAETRAAVGFGKLADRLRAAAGVAAGDDVAAVQAAQETMAGMGARGIGEYGGVQRELAGMGILGGEAGGGGKLEQIAGAAKRLMVGFAPFQMRRMWSMFGAPVFNQMIPAAAKAEMAGWQLTQAMGAPTGGMPEGIAGGVMQYYAAQRQAQISGGRAGFRAWGAGLPAMQAMKEAQGIFGPALGAGGAAAIGAYAVGGVTLGAAGAAGIGAAVAAPLAGYAALRYLGSFGEPTAENALTMWRPGAQPIVGAGLAGLGRPGGIGQMLQAGVMEAGYALRAPEAGQMYPGIPGAPAPPDMDYSRQMERRAFQIAGTPIMQLGAQDRMAALNKAAQLMGAEGTVWAGMDEGQRLGALRQFAPYAPEMSQLSMQGLITRAGQQDWWVSQAVSAGIDPRQYEGMAGQMQMGAGGATWLTQQALQQPGAAAQRAWGMGMQQLAPLSRFGITPQQISGYAQAGPFAGAQARHLQRLMGGSRQLWSQMARGGQAPAWAETMEESGLPIYTSQMWELQDQATEAQRGYQTFQTGQQWQGLIGGSRYQRRRWRLQDRAQAAGDLYQRGQFAFQAEGLRLSDAQFWESTALQERRLGAQAGRGLEDITTGYERGMTRLGWAEQDLGISTGRGRMQFDWQAVSMSHQVARSATQYGWGVADVARGWERQQIGFGQQAQDIARGWGRQQTQFGWAQEDLSQRRAVGALQFGWQMEDFEENIRFAVGRGRQRMMTQQERAVTMRNIQVGQMETEEGRMEERQRWAEEEHTITLDRFQERRQWAEEDHDTTVDRMHEQREWALTDQETAREQLEQRRSWLEEDYEKEKGRIDVRREWLEEDHGRSRDRHEEDISWAEEQLELRKKHHVEDMDLSERKHEAAAAHFEETVKQREEIERLDREKWREDYKRAVEALAAATAHRKEMDGINLALLETNRQQQLQIAAWNKFWEEGGEFSAIFQQILDNLIDVNSRLAITH